MKENFEKSLRMIKDCGIKSEEEYNKLRKHYLLLSVESLKYISGKSDFDEIKNIAKKCKNQVVAK